MKLAIIKKYVCVPNVYFLIRTWLFLKREIKTLYNNAFFFYFSLNCNTTKIKQTNVITEFVRNKPLYNDPRKVRCFYRNI